MKTFSELSLYLLWFLFISFHSSSLGFHLKGWSCSHSPSSTLNVNCVHRHGSNRVVSELVILWCRSTTLSLCVRVCAAPHLWLKKPHMSRQTPAQRKLTVLIQKRDGRRKRRHSVMDEGALCSTLCWSFYTNL